MSPSQTHATPAAFPVAMDIMDRAEAMARDCFQKQGMETEAQAVTAVVESLPGAVASLPAPVKEKSVPPAASNVNRMLEKICLTAICLLPPIAVACAFACAPVTPTESKTVSPQWTGIRTVRGMAARFTTEEAQRVVASSARDDDTNSITPEAMATTKRLGQVSIIDRVGRPEVHWSGVSQETCTAIVKDIYDSPSERGVVATVDGKSVGVSCDGPSHEVVLSPHI